MTTDEGGTGGAFRAPRGVREGGRSRLSGVVLSLGPLLSPVAAALDPERAVTQYVHESWRDGRISFRPACHPGTCTASPTTLAAHSRAGRSEKGW